MPSTITRGQTDLPVQDGRLQFPSRAAQLRWSASGYLSPHTPRPPPWPPSARRPQAVARQRESPGPQWAISAWALAPVYRNGHDDHLARPSLLRLRALAPSLFGGVFPAAADAGGGVAEPHRWDLLGPIHYVGLDNWRSVLVDRTFGNSLFVTLAFIALVVPAQIVLGLPPRHCWQRLPGSGLFRTSASCPGSARHWPSRCCGAGSGTHRRGRQHRAGAANRMADRSGTCAARGLRRDGVDQRRLRRPVLPRRHSRHPPQVHAAARLDGATAWQRFWHITLPMLRPTLFFASVTGIVSAAQVFDTVTR